MSLASKYPFPKFRPYIEDALADAEAAFDSGKKFVMINAPTGSGKSAVAVAFARHFRSAILTPTKILQNQYADTKEFGTEYTIFGKSNYRCGLKAFKHLTVDQAICCSDAATREYADMTDWEKELKKEHAPAMTLKGRCTSAGICEYYKLISSIPVKPSPVVNYDLFFHLKKTPLNPSEGTNFGENVVFDEAHHLMSKARSVFGYKISETAVENLLGKDARRRQGESPAQWLARHVLLSSELLKKEGDLKAAPELYKFNINTSFISQFEIEDKNKFFIDDKGSEVDIKPVNFKYLKNIIFYPFKKVLLLSATFPKNFCEIFNISDDEIEVIDIPSSFPKEKRPLLFVKDLPALNYKTEFTSTHPTIAALRVILEKHARDKGIIHCSNYSFFRQLQKLFKHDKRFVWVEQGQDKSKHLVKHASAKNASVLVSPAMLEGVDLKDDLARFQVMIKLPFPTLDDYTKRMMALYSNYYDNEVATSVMQAYGRAVRSEDDHATFYVLDGAFSRFAGRKDLLSRYTLEAYKSITTKDLEKFKVERG
jgi:Rad3-related DNA helicase